MSSTKPDPLPRPKQRTTILGIAAALVIVAAALLVGACGSSSSDTASPAASGAPTEMRIGYQLIPNGDLIVKDQGWLEDALPGTTIKWIKFDSGADVNTARKSVV